MEAAAALGLAGNIVQFLDFSQKLSKTIFEIWNSANGITKLNSDKELLAQSFLTNLDSVCEDLFKYQGFLLHQCDQDDHIQAIIDGCRRLTDDLIQRIDKLRVTGQPSKLKSLMAAVKFLWKEQELVTLESQLSKFRHELESRVLFSLRISMNTLETQQKSLSDTLLELRRLEQFEELQSSISTVIENTIRAQITALPQWHMTPPLPEELVGRLQPLGSSVVDSYRSSGVDSSMVEKSHASSYLPGAPKPLQNLERIMAQTYATKLANSEGAALKALSFPVMHDREEAIAIAEASTFDWIFRPPRCTDRPWDNFSEWLKGEASFYWINGKAGSGKSTLMKHLTSHEETRAGLRKWAGGTKLLISKFFFWYSGYDLQKSQVGLLRGLLYSCLMGHRELIPLVMPEAAEVNEAELASYWTMPRLRRAFQRLVTQTKFDLKFCFFIDGLDEYAGVHSEIAEFIKKVASQANVKICASSRPLAVFDPVFQGFPHLILQNVTFDDISLFVSNRLIGNQLMSNLERDEPGLRAELTRSIVTKASGVFLWVCLVVQSLLDGLSNHDVGNDLKRRLEDLSPDLEDLYWQMIDRVQPKWYLEEGIRLLRLVHAAGGQISLLHLCLAEQTVDLHQERLMSEPSSKERVTLCQRMTGRLKSRCLGLLEIMPDQELSVEAQTVTFIHKSVYDFLETNEAKTRMMGIPGQDKFQPEVALMRGTLLEIKTFTAQLPEDRGFKRNDFLDHIRPAIYRFLVWAQFAEKRYQRAEAKLLDELRDTTDALWDEVGFRSETERAGDIHWMSAPRNPAAATISGEYDSDFKEVLTWKNLRFAPLNTPTDICCFEDLVGIAELQHYMSAKNIPRTASNASGDPSGGRTCLPAPAEILTRYDPTPSLQQYQRAPSNLLDVANLSSSARSSSIVIKESPTDLESILPYKTSIFLRTENAGIVYNVGKALLVEADKPTSLSVSGKDKSKKKKRQLRWGLFSKSTEKAVVLLQGARR